MLDVSSQSERPACLLPWQENPYRLVSFWRMFQIFAHRFVGLMDDLRAFEDNVRTVWPKLQESNPTHLAIVDADWEAFQRVQTHCEGLKLTSSLKQIRTIRETAGKVSYVDLSAMLKQLRTRIVEDTEDRVFFCIPPEKIPEFFQKAEMGPLVGELVPKTAAELLGNAVCNNFKSSIRDIDEASRCLVTLRATAAVFHLMRVMEVGLRCLGKRLNDPCLDPSRNPTWDAILKKCDAECSKPFAQQCPEWQSDPTFFAGATANLRAVQRAWRNPTMHVERHYEPEEAHDIWISVGGFIRHLATKLNE